MIKLLLNILNKEFTLVLKDIHALLVLFIMPMAFILVMSLALPDTASNIDKDRPKIGLIFQQPEDSQLPASQALTKLAGFHTQKYNNEKELRENIINDQLIAMIVVPENFIQLLQKNEPIDNNLGIYYSPSTPSQLRFLLMASVRQVTALWQLEKKLKSKVSDSFMQQGLKDKFLGVSLVSEHEISISDDKVEAKQPSSVQQSVPAWLIFSMFFVVIPLSTTFIVEKQHGTLQRLKTMPIKDGYFIFGKIIPYIIINLIQTLLMFLVGMYLVPAAGGQALQLSANAWLLIPMSMSISILAISLAMLIAVRVNTTDQATTIGGVTNLLLAAVGGVMVPTYVMPEVMKNISGFSPMNWGLEGFLTILLREGSFTDILPEMMKLLSLSAVCLFFAVTSYKHLLRD
ncbi:MAG: ABC transporter permease [Gammaproteobacteria bacterium]|nr:ABC transporter permease [Gammaproteobacteria bacterium]